MLRYLGMIKTQNPIVKWILIGLLILSLYFILFMGGCYGLAKLIYVSKGCEQFHIDNTEMHTDIDIPKINEIDCSYGKSQKLKRTYFVIDKTKIKMLRYIAFSEFKALANSHTFSLTDFFRCNADSIRKLNSRNTLFYKEESKDNGEYYKALLDSTTGQVWVNLKYAD